MKAYLSWLCDPYIHVLLVGLVLIKIASTASVAEDAPEAKAPRVLACPRCGEHLEQGGCPQLFAEARPKAPTR